MTDILNRIFIYMNNMRRGYPVMVLKVVLLCTIIKSLRLRRIDYGLSFINLLMRGFNINLNDIIIRILFFESQKNSYNYYFSFKFQIQHNIIMPIKKLLSRHSN